MKILGCMTWIAVGGCLALTSCRDEIDEGPTEAEIVAELQAKKQKEAEERERARKESVERMMATLRSEESASAENVEASASAEERKAAKRPVSTREKTAAAVPVRASASEKAKEAHLRANAQADRRDKMKKLRGKIINLKAKREAVDSRIMDYKGRLREAEDAAEIARFGDPSSRIKLSGADSRKTAEADAKVEKIKADMLKLQEAYEGYRDEIAEQTAIYNTL